jgi:hypothetical protein
MSPSRFRVERAGQWPAGGTEDISRPEAKRLRAFAGPDLGLRNHAEKYSGQARPLNKANFPHNKTMHITTAEERVRISAVPGGEKSCRV